MTEQRCPKCNDTGTISVPRGGGTEPRAPGTPQVYGMYMRTEMCTEEDCVKRRFTNPKPNHEAHCPAFSRPDDDCDCLYPELERLRALVCQHRQSRCVECIMQKNEMFECTCGNRYDIKFFFSNKEFDCFCCGARLVISP